MSPKIRVISPYLSFPCYATLHHIWQTSTSLPTVGKRKTDRAHSISVIFGSPKTDKMLYFCNGSLSRLIVQSPKKRNYASVPQPCTDSAQILLQICSKSEPNVITRTSPIKAKDIGGSLDFSNLHPQENETKQIHVTRNNGDLPRICHFLVMQLCTTSGRPRHRCQP